MQVKLSRGGVLHALEYGKVGKDVSEVAHAYLNTPVVVDEAGITVGDVYDLIAKNPILVSVYERNFVESFLEYIKSVPEKKRLALYNKEQKKPNAIEYVELSRHIEYDAVNQKLDLFNSGLLYVCAMSKVLQRSYDGFKKGDRINYSLTGVDVAMLYHMPIKYKEVAIATQENHFSARPVNRREYSSVREFIVPVFTLNELLESLTWELSFHGSPKSSKAFVEELSSRVKESKAQYEFTDCANEIVKKVREVYDAHDNDQVIALYSQVKGDTSNAAKHGEQFIELVGVQVPKKIKESGDYEICKKVAGYAMHVIYTNEDRNEDVDVDYIVGLAKENLNEKQYLIKKFHEVVEVVEKTLEADIPKDEAHAERNQIVKNKIAETKQKVETDNIVQKDLQFIVNELEDVLVDIEKGRVTEVFIHIDRINEESNRSFRKRYKEKLYGFSKLPESMDDEKKEKLSELIDCLPDEASFDDFVEVMFQNSATLIDEAKGLTAYEYRVKSVLYRQKTGLFSVHDNKALEAKEKASHQCYLKEVYDENQVMPEAKKIVEAGRSIFNDDVEYRLKATHKLAVNIRPDVALLRWKTIVPPKPKKKVKV